MQREALHILFLTGWYPSRVAPDNGDFIQRHAEAISLLHKVTVIHVKSDKNASKSIEVSDTTHKNVRSLIAYVKPSSLGFVKAVQFAKAYRTLFKKADAFDIVHLNKLYPSGLITLFLKLFKQKKYLLSEHYHGYYTPYNTKIGFLEKQLSKIITKQASYVCPVSNSLGSAMQAFGLTGTYQKVPNVVNTDIFTPKTTKAKKFTILHASSMSEIKNVNLILEVVATLQDTISNFKFNLIGRGADKYQELSKQLGIYQKNIRFIDQISQEELAKYYKEAHVFVLFSDIETFSIVTYEAFASGTPVIATNVGAINENFPKNYGFLIEKGNKKQLLDKILKIHTGFIPLLPKKMHNYVVENFSREIIAKEFSNLYNKIHYSKDK